MMSRILSPQRMVAGAPSHAPPDTRFAPGLCLSRALGWFSIALGAVEFLAPETLSRLTGVRSTGLLRAYGLREVICGVGILNSQRPTLWIWTRVAGDICDLAALGEAAAEGSSADARRAEWTIAAVAGVTVLDVLNAAELSTAAFSEG